MGIEEPDVEPEVDPDDISERLKIPDVEQVPQVLPAGMNPQNLVESFFANHPDEWVFRGHLMHEEAGRAVKRPEGEGGYRNAYTNIKENPEKFGRIVPEGLHVERWNSITEEMARVGGTKGIDSLAELETVVQANAGSNAPGFGSFTGSPEVARRFVASGGISMTREESEEVTKKFRQKTSKFWLSKFVIFSF